MRIILASPLYPPDIAAPAPYVKELAKRLATTASKDAQGRVSIVTYSDMPELIPGVEIIYTSKHRPLLFRIFSYTVLLARASKEADVIYVENGASVELPVILVSLITRTPIILHLSDSVAHARASRSIVFGTIERLVRTRAKKVITEMPLERPEILPFVPEPIEQITAYEESWNQHTKMLHELFKTTTHGN